MIKRLRKLFFVAILGSVLLLTACLGGDKTFFIELPDGVVANIEDIREIKEGSNITLTVTIPDGKSLEYLKVNGIAIEMIDNTYTFKISEDTIVTVSFKDLEPTTDYFKLTLPDGVTANKTNLDEIEKDTEVTLTVAVPEGKELEYLKVDNEEVTVADNKYTFSITKNTTVTVSFKDITVVVEKYKLTLPEGVTSNIVNLDEIEKDTEVTLTVAVPEGKELEYLKVDNEEVTVTDNKYTFSITKNTTVTVSFKDVAIVVEKYKLTLPDGVTANKTNLDEIEKDTEVTLTVTVPEGKELEYLKVDNEEVTVADNKYTFSITKNTTVTVSFKDITVVVEKYKLTLPEGVTSNIVNLDEIEKDTEVTLIVTVPEGKELDYLEVNNQKVTLVDNKYTFTITEDTVAKLLFILPGGWQEADLNDLIFLLVDFDGKLFHPGNLNLMLLMNYDEETAYDIDFLVNFDNDLNITKFVFDVFVADEDNIIEGIIYNDGNYLYRLDKTELENQEIEALMALNLNNYFLELFLPMAFSYIIDEYGGIEIFANVLPRNLLSINDLSSEFYLYIVQNYLDELEDLDELIDLLYILEFSTKDDFFKIALSIDEEDIFNIINDLDLDDLLSMLDIDLDDFDSFIFNLNFELLFKDNKFNSIEITVDVFEQKSEDKINIELFIGYVDKEVVEPFDVSEVDKDHIEVSTYYIYLEDEVIEFIIDKNMFEDIFNDIVYELDIEVIEDLLSLMKIYKEDGNSIGLYKDEQLQEALTIEDLFEDEVHIYIKWEDKKTYSDLITNLLTDDKLLLISMYGDIYYEDDDFIVNSYNFLTTLYVKEEDKKYLVDFVDGEIYLYESDLINEIETNSILDLLNDDSSSFIIDFNNIYINLDKQFVVMEDMLFILDFDSIFIKLPEEIQDEMLGSIDDLIEQVDDLLNNVIVDEILYYYPTWIKEYIIDINELEQLIMFYVEYESGFSNELSLEELMNLELIDYELVDDDGYELTLYDEYGQEMYYYQEFLFYDGSLGKVVYFPDLDELFYLDELDDFPKLKDSFKIITHWIFGKAVINTIEELKEYESDKKIYVVTPVVELIDFNDALELVKERNYLFGNSFTYDLQNDLWFVGDDYWENIILKFNQDYIAAWDDEIYYQIPYDNFNLESFYDSVLYDYTNHEVLLIFSINDLLKGNFTNVKVRDDIYIIDDNIRVYISDKYMNFESEEFGDSYYFVDEIDKIIYDDEFSYKYVVKNNLDFGDVVYKAHDPRDIYFSIEHPNGPYVFSGYIFDDYYELVDGQPDFTEPFYKDHYDETENVTIYARYFPYVDVMDYLDEIINKEEYTLESTHFKFVVKKDLRIDYYFKNRSTNEFELEYVIDLDDNITYKLYEGTLYKLIEQDQVVNLVELFDSLEEYQFRYDGINSFSYNNYYEFQNINRFEVNAAKDYIIFASHYFSTYSDQKLYLIDEANMIDLDEYPVEEEKIVEIIPNTYHSVIVYGELEYYLNFKLKYNTSTSEDFIFYSYDEFFDIFDAIFIKDEYGDIIEFELDDEILTLNLNDFDIYVIGENEIGVYFDEINEFYFLSELEELPIIELIDKPFYVFKGWYYYYEEELVTLEQLHQDFSPGEAITLYPFFDFVTFDEAVDYINDNDEVNILMNNNGTEYNIYYNFTNDQFIIEQLFDYHYLGIGEYQEGDKLVITFSGEDIIIEDKYNYISYNKDFSIGFGWYLDHLFGVNDFTEVYSDLYDLRNILNGNYEYNIYSNRIEEYNIYVYFSEDFIELFNYSGFEIVLNLKTNTILIDEHDPRTYNLTIINNINEYQITYDITHEDVIEFIIFELEGYYFESYYLCDENGEPDFNTVVIGSDIIDNYGSDMLIFAKYIE